jgi:glycosyltransferase involved in cell wall biosynthesis
MNPTSTVILSTSRDPRRLEIVLTGLSRQSIFPSQLIIAEDGEDAPTAQLIESWKSRLPFPVAHVRQPHTGFRKSRILNEAILSATGDLVILLDGDCAPHRRFVADHLSLILKNHFTQGRRSFIEEEGIHDFATGASLLKLWLRGHLKRPFKSLRLPVPRIREDAKMDGTLGCNLAVWRADLDAINGFDESYEGWGREDSDMTARLIHLGRRRRVVWGQALVFHLNHPTQPRTGLASNDERLATVLASRSVRAQRGLAEHRADQRPPVHA